MFFTETEYCTDQWCLSFACLRTHAAAVFDAAVSVHYSVTVADDEVLVVQQLFH
jgi:hypothetical protein